MILHPFCIVLTLFWTKVQCELVLDDSGNGCKEVACLFAEMSQIRRLVSEQAQMIAGHRQLIEHQNTLIARMQIEGYNQDALILHLQDELESMKRQVLLNKAESQGDATLTSPRVVVSRGDDLGSMEAVVDQMGQRLAAVSADIQALQNTDQVLQNTANMLQSANQVQDLRIEDARSSTFIRWGNSQCTGHSQLIYNGVVGGAVYHQHGGGSNYLCLTMSPVFSDHHLLGDISNYAHVFGAEYETNDAVHDFDPVCAFCRASHATTIMIPGTNVCTQGWTKQYDGYLVTERDEYSSADFICVDSALESRPGGSASEDGVLLYYTLARCGALPCGPYAEQKILTCVVCSR